MQLEAFEAVHACQKLAPYSDGARKKNTGHIDSLVEGNCALRQRPFLEYRPSIDIHSKVLRSQNGLCEFRDSSGIVQLHNSVDINDSAILGLDFGNSDYRQRRGCTGERDGRIEGEDLGVIDGMVGQDLGLVDMDRIRGWVAEHQVCDVEL